MKKRLLVLPLAAMLLAGCGETPSPQPKPDEPTPGPVVPTKTLTGIEVATQPTKVNYKEGETFNPAGMVVNAVYSDESKEVITNYQVPNQALTPEVTKITISYQGKTTEVDIIVTPVQRYTITFMSNETEKIKDVVCKEGEVPSCEYSIPSTEQYDFVLLGWSLTPNGKILPELPEATENATYYAIISENIRKYPVIFNDFNGNLISSSEVEYGSAPETPDYEPEDTAQYDYTFIGWALTLGGKPVAKPDLVSGPVTYYAVVESTVRSYTVKFFNENGTEVQSGTLQYGATPSCDYEVEDTAEWDYTTKWAASEGGTALATLPTVTGNANYYAIATRVKQKYDISFLNEDGSAYKKINFEYGTVPSVTAPTKTADKQYTYTFAGWSLTKGGEVLASLPSVTGEATYYAIFGKTVNKYNLKLDFNYEDSEAKTLSLDYGTSIDDEDLEEYIPEREGYHFAGWCSDVECEEKVSFPLTFTDNITLYAKWNEKIEIAKYLKALLGIKDYDPYSFIPDTLKPNFEDNFIESEDVLDYSEAQLVSNIKKQGFGEQWQMVIDNMNQSEKFYNILSASDSVFTAALAAFINYFEDSAHSDATSYEEEKADNYDASCSFVDGILTFSLDFKKEVLGFSPKIEMVYTVETAEKIIFISLNDNNKLKCAFTTNSYVFGISYGITIGGKTGLRTAYCQLDKLVDEEDEENISYNGHIYEYFSYVNDESEKDLVKSAADFYIDGDYCSVVGNKASGLIGFTGYINELYDVTTGYLYGYKVQEALSDSIPLVGGKTYYTLWFNLFDIANITSVKAIDKGEAVTPNVNPDNVYLNGKESIFKVKKNGIASRKYDCERRSHFYYGLDGDSKLVQYETKVPMMFIQDDNIYDFDGKYTNFSDFPEDMADNGYDNVSVTLSEEVLTKIRNDHKELIPVFKENKENVTSEAIIEWLK